MPTKENERQNREKEETYACVLITIKWLMRLLSDKPFIRCLYLLSHDANLWLIAGSIKWHKHFLYKRLLLNNQQYMTSVTRLVDVLFFSGFALSPSLNSLRWHVKKAKFPFCYHARRIQYSDHLTYDSIERWPLWIALSLPLLLASLSHTPPSSNFILCHVILRFSYVIFHKNAVIILLCNS